ncbi:hypothetical protein NUW58_g2336 [Xylaria curta]|uniref:Uncharacterized protein n=1 Tax=Xylaria curta TaxID=42375 RepID=A0ACC1PG03_9PEZI|nr:hypothetical protein NUW58_g2336 [Xylaria curta]
MSPTTDKTVKTTLVVGIDFGTTFSGVSWLICKAGSPPGQPEVVSLWQTSTDNRRNNSDSQKVPSKVYYDQNGELSWGFKIPAGVQTIEWFKLLLLNDDDLQSHLRNSSHLYDAKKSLQKLGKTAVQLVGEYLGVLWEHVLEQIKNSKGEAIINGMPIQVILTVPAIWTDYARDRMREAAGLAGIFDYRVAGETTLLFVSEPEAAAIATMPELENREDLRVGDSLVVVDAGGGTVDIISYKINVLEPLSVSECAEGGGALCGGIFLDKHFEALLKKAVGEASWNKMNGSDVRRLMNNEWEHGIKQAFDGEPDFYTVELPSRAQTPERQFSSDEIRPIFDKIANQIGGLVRKQIAEVRKKTSRLPKLVILVGGFGRSPYIFKYLKQNLGCLITVLQTRGDKPWTAICRGAALFGAAGLSSDTVDGQQLVQSRIARLNYGIELRHPFIEGVHDPRDKVWCNLTREWYASNQMQWFIRRGEDMSLKKANTYDYIREWDINLKGWGVFPETIYTCPDLIPPSRKQGNVREDNKFTIRTTKAREEYEKVSNGYCYYRRWSFSYKVVVSGASFDIALISDGVEQNLEKVQVDVC